LSYVQHQLAQTQDALLRAHEREIASSSHVLIASHHRISVGTEAQASATRPVPPLPPVANRSLLDYEQLVQAQEINDDQVCAVEQHIRAQAAHQISSVCSANGASQGPGKRGRQLTLSELADSAGGATMQQDIIAAQEEATRFRAERDEIQSKLNLLTITNDEMTHRIQSLTRELELLATGNTRLRENIRNIEMEHARQVDVIRRQNSHDMQVSLNFICPSIANLDLPYLSFNYLFPQPCN
jgi:hypothetical protein